MQRPTEETDSKTQPRSQGSLLREKLGTRWGKIELGETWCSWLQWWMMRTEFLDDENLNFFKVSD